MINDRSTNRQYEINHATLSEAIELVIDYRGKTPKKLGGDWSTSGYRALSAKNIKTGSIVQPETIRYVDEDLYKKWMKDEVQREDIFITSEAPFGQIYYWDSDEKIVLSQRIFALRTKKEFCSKYLYYYMTTPEFQAELDARATGTTVVGLRQPELLKCKIKYPPVEVQRKIAGVLGALDDKIELNNKINQNLELQAQALFKSWFVDKINPNRKTIKAEEFFNITIGKTPPRKEPEWFSKNTNDIKWISISDMGNCGLYISDSSEYLVPESISKFNVKIVPDNTVLLSFKLTVGRIAITDGEMATNEAIAHFGTNKKEINEYLYYYLKNFNFQTMGSTSSIATAVNSKIIKSMPFVMPEESELKDFHSVISPMFAQIKANQRENIQLSALRDTLLPKLMSGKINVDNVEVFDGKE